jgi:hypothetical protein
MTFVRVRDLNRRMATPSAGRLLFASAVVLPLISIVSAFFVEDAAGQRFLVAYVAPLFLAAPLWVRTRLKSYALHFGTRGAIDLIIVGLSFARFVAGEILPFSGHMLFLTYSGITTSVPWYRFLVLVLLVETTWFKLWVWRDATSWSLGLLLGLIAAAVVLASDRLTER